MLATIDEALLARCDRPAPIPASAGLARQAELWAADRRALLACGWRHDGLAGVIRAERAGLQGGKR